MQALIGLLAIALLPALAGCNTTRGLGQDLKAAGRTVSELAEETRAKLED